MSVKIKICGLKRPEDIEYVNRYRPEYAGFVFYPPSSRYVTAERAAELSRRLLPGITPVGVFLDNSPEEILQIAESGAIRVIQLHGGSAPELVRRLRGVTDLPLWEAVRVSSREDIRWAESSEADMVLLDHGPGGTGEAFDWSLLKEIRRKFFLAGGLKPSNVREALECSPWGVDVSSGVETDKRKDPDKIRELIRIVRAEEEK